MNLCLAGVSLREILELLSFVGTTITGVVAVVVFKQLKLSMRAVEISVNQLNLQQKDIEMRAQREAGMLAASLCEKYGNEVAIQSSILQQKLGVPNGKLKTFMANEITAGDHQWLVNSAKHEKELLELLNKVESIAIFFERGLADENLAFPALAPIYCNYCEMMWPAIAHHRPLEGPHLFKSTVAIYNIWKPRLEKEKLLIKSGILKEELNKIPDTTPKPPFGAQGSITNP